VVGEESRTHPSQRTNDQDDRAGERRRENKRRSKDAEIADQQKPEANGLRLAVPGGSQFGANVKPAQRQDERGDETGEDAER
jgi:hypothetical protein